MQLLSKEERQQKVRVFLNDLSARFNECLFDNPEKLALVQKLKPSMIEEFWERMDTLDALCVQYINAEVPWDGDQLDLQFTPLTKSPVSILIREPDVANAGRELFTWLLLQTKDL